MTTPISPPQAFQKYVSESGQLTQAGVILLKQYYDRIVDLETRLAALEP